MNEERKMVLEMLKDGKINVDDAERLMLELDNKANNSKKNEELAIKDPNKKFIRINVVDGEDTKVNVNIPVALAEIGFKMAPKEKLELINKQGLKVEDIIKLIEEGAEGEIVNIQSNEGGKNTFVRVYIE